MTTINWPLEIPQTLKIESLQAQYDEAVLRTDMDAGPKKTRLRFTAVPKKYTGVTTLTESQLEIMEAFYTAATKYGSLRFVMSDPITGEKKEFRFLSSPAVAARDGLFDVTLNVEKL